MRWLALWVIIVAVGMALWPGSVAAQEAVHVVQPGDTLGGLAARYGTTVQALAEANGIVNRNLIYVGQRLVIPDSVAPTVPAAPSPSTPSSNLPAPFTAVRLSTARPIQGQTVQLNVALARPAALQATFRGESLRFSPTEQGAWALLAVGPLAPVITDRLVITATNEAETASLTLPIAIQDAGFRTQNLTLDPETSQLLDPDLIEGEAARLEALFKTGQGAPLWNGLFVTPGGGRVTADFGERRRYNDGPVSYHEGIDYALPVGTPVRAAAAGVVALAERLTVRGNTVFIDHGMGVYSGYFHMSQLAVQPGEKVAPGEIIGWVGSTGLSTGPHLHWEIRLHGINVSPWQWLRESFG